MRKIVKAMTAALLIGAGCVLLPGCGSTPSASGTAATQQVPKGEKEQATYYMNQMDQCIEKAKTIRKQFEEDNKAKAADNLIIKDMVENNGGKIIYDVQKVPLDQVLEAWTVLHNYDTREDIKENDKQFNEANQKLGDLINHGKNGPAIDKMVKDWRHKKYNDDVIREYRTAVSPATIREIQEEIIRYAQIPEYEFSTGSTTKTRDDKLKAKTFAKENNIKFMDLD